MSAVASPKIREILVQEVTLNIPEDQSWKKVVVAVFPILGAFTGMMSLKKLEARAAQDIGGEAKLSLAKVRQTYHGLVFVNTCSYGLASLSYAYGQSDWGFVAFGATLLYTSLGQARYIDDMDRLIRKLTTY